MKLINVSFLILTVLNFATAQNDDKVYNTMSFFYIDNSSDGSTGGLNKEVKNFLKLKMNEQENMKDNYVFTFTVDGENSVLSDNVSKAVSFDYLAQYLSKGSALADYKRDNDTLKKRFTETHVKVKTELSFYIFISSKAVTKMIKEMNEMPTPITFPFQLAAYTTFEKMLQPKIFFITNEDVRTKYNEAQIKRCFTLYLDKSSDVNPDPIIIFK